MHVRVLLTEFLDAFIHPVEPVYAGHLDYRDDGLVGRGLCDGNRSSYEGDRGKSDSESIEFHVSVSFVVSYVLRIK
jgi:hypothetical protein